VVLKDNVSSDARFRYVDPPDVEVTNVDLTYKGGFYVSAVSGATDENGQTATFSVRLTSQPDNDSSFDNVTITVVSSDTSEGVILGASKLVFKASDWNAAQTVTVLGVHDSISDGDQSYSILLGADNTTSDARFRYVDPPDVSMTNLDLTDKGAFYVSRISNTTDENGATASFTIRLSSAPADNGTTAQDNVTITMSVSDTTEGEIVSIGNKQTGDNTSALVFTDSNWSAERTVTVRGVFDNITDGDQKYTVVLKDNVSSDARFRYVDPPDVEVTNVDLT
ncbi:uncharacterized protein METZ01_LOCUS170345, partial [marine metagenome]